MKVATDENKARTTNGRASSEAIASYARFVAMRSAGSLPAGVRFQACLPIPTAVGHWFVREAVVPCHGAPTSPGG